VLGDAVDDLGVSIILQGKNPHRDFVSRAFAR
jgi:hypothetical protein